MSVESIVSKKVIEGKTIFRIHHIINGDLVGIQAVEETPEKTFRKILNWRDGGDIEDFMNEMEDIKAVAEFEKQRVLKYLDTFSEVGQRELVEFLAKEKAGTLELFVTANENYYAFVSEETSKLEGANFLRGYTVRLNRDGNFKNLQGFRHEEDVQITVSHFASALEEGDKVFIQIDMNTILGIRRSKDSVEITYVKEEREESGVSHTTRLLTGVDSTHKLLFEAEAGLLTMEHNWSEDEKEAFIYEMMPILSGMSSDEIVKESLT